MKKLCILALVLCLLCPGALSEVSDLYITASHVNTYADGENVQVYVVFEMENRGDELLMPDVAASVLMTKNNEIFREASWPMMYPPVLQPGARCYVANAYTLGPDEQALYDHAELRIAMGERSKDENTMIAEMAQAFSYPETACRLTDAGVEIEITKDAGAECMVLLLCRNAAGEVILIFEQPLLAIPAGETYRHTYPIPAYIDESIHSVEAVCYTLPM